MSNDAHTIVQKLWNYCHVLRDDGVGYGDYIQQLTNILFLKMADEQSKPPFNNKSIIPKEYDWNSLMVRKGEELEIHYRDILENLGKKQHLLGLIYRKSQNKIQDPAKLERLIKLINEETWIGLDVDVKGEIYEGLLKKNAEGGKKGAGQYFTPRALISAIVEVMMPQPGEVIYDPACGTGGFFLTSHDYMKNKHELDRDQKKFLSEKTFHGSDIVVDVVRLCAMNMHLHGIGKKENQIIQGDSLISDPGGRYDVVMTNPPFGIKSSVKIFSAEGKKEKISLSYERDDFWTTTKNKQLNFLQHVKTTLKINGRCAIVIPDNVLFEGNAGKIIRKKLINEYDVHTLLRLPAGIFYAGGVKANVLFFDKKPARSDGNAWTEKLWIYDFRTNQHFTQKENPLNKQDLNDFIKCYNAKNKNKRKETKKFKSYTYDELIKRDDISFDILWLEDESIQNMVDILPPKKIINNIKNDLKFMQNSINELVNNFDNK